mmetsp:Transcript_36640/g.112898  ORF Transcript_36640/g.112898 Transcript_36640/m.112898 type:complete len:290 (-) Transcript_36640:91-960(-)
MTCHHVGGLIRQIDGIELEIPESRAKGHYRFDRLCTCCTSGEGDVAKLRAAMRNSNHSARIPTVQPIAVDTSVSMPANNRTFRHLQIPKPRAVFRDREQHGVRPELRVYVDACEMRPVAKGFDDGRAVVHSPIRVVTEGKVLHLRAGLCDDGQCTAAQAVAVGQAEGAQRRRRGWKRRGYKVAVREVQGFEARSPRKQLPHGVEPVDGAPAAHRGRSHPRDVVARRFHVVLQRVRAEDDVRNVPEPMCDGAVTLAHDTEARRRSVVGKRGPHLARCRGRGLSFLSCIRR